MAAGTIADKVVTETIIQGYIGGNLTEKFSLLNSGAIEMDSNPPFSAALNGGQSFQKKFRIAGSYSDQTPTAATDLTVNAIDSEAEKGVIFRRANVYGEEDLANIAGGDTIGGWKAFVGQKIATEIANNVETRFFQKLLPGIVKDATTAGQLATTNLIDKTGQPFDPSYFGLANALIGENSGSFTGMFMHPAIYWNTLASSIVTPASASDIATYRALNLNFVGMMGTVKVFLNERVYNPGSDATNYDTVLFSPGAFYFGSQLANSVTVWRDELLAGGTELVKYLLAYSIHYPGVSFSGTLPTVIGGVTDAAVVLTTNWTVGTRFKVGERPFAIIRAAKG